MVEYSTVANGMASVVIHIGIDHTVTAYASEYLYFAAVKHRRWLPPPGGATYS